GYPYDHRRKPNPEECHQVDRPRSSVEMNAQVFREYDIRGIVEHDFDKAFVTNLGRAYATIFHRAGKRNVTLGRDCRLSSPSLREWLLEGLLESVSTWLKSDWSRRRCSTFLSSSGKWTGA